MTEVATAEEALKRAYMILKGVEGDLEGFRIQLVQVGNDVEQSSLGGSILKGLTSRLAIRREKQDFHRNLDLAAREIETAEKVDVDAVLKTEGGSVNGQALKSLVDRFRGDVEFISGKVREAVTHYHKSIDKYEFGDTYFMLGMAHEFLKQPGKALQAFDKCSKLEPNDELGVEALKNVERLKSRMFLGGWFVGSWKIVLVLAGLTVMALLFMTKEPAAGITNVILWGGILALYWWRKWRA